MIKLYKKIDGKFHYYEAWQNKKEVVVHWGVVGEKGEIRQIPIKSAKIADTTIKTELDGPRANGFGEIEDLVSIIVQYNIEGFGNDTDLRKRYEIEGFLNELLGWTGNGYCDSGDIGSGTMNIFSYVVDPDIALISMVINMKEKDILDGAIIAWEINDEYEVVYPTNYSGDFDIL